eukprot:7161334-Alexandrium_andersonii.AAC.1
MGGHAAQGPLQAPATPAHPAPPQHAQRERSWTACASPATRSTRPCTGDRRETSIGRGRQAPHRPPAMPPGASGGSEERRGPAGRTAREHQRDAAAHLRAAARAERG